MTGERQGNRECGGPKIYASRRSASIAGLLIAGRLFGNQAIYRTGGTSPGCAVRNHCMKSGTEAAPSGGVHEANSTRVAGS